MVENQYRIVVLFDGYSEETEQGTKANCTCTLIKGPKRMIVDTMTAWDGWKLEQALKEQNVKCDDIDYVICTHGHSDHVGCNYLFKNATHIVGFDMSYKNRYFPNKLNSGEEFLIDNYVKVIPTPGHTLQHVSVLVETRDKGVVAVTGDLFENEFDRKDEQIWKDAGATRRSCKLKVATKSYPLQIGLFPVTGACSK